MNKRGFGKIKKLVGGKGAFIRHLRVHHVMFLSATRSVSFAFRMDLHRQRKVMVSEMSKRSTEK